MKTNLEWRKGLLSSTYRIYDEGRQVGVLREHTFAQTANGELNGMKYTFRTKGFLNQKTDIIDDRSGETIGEIEYNTWMTKATLTFGNRIVFWKYNNMWNTKWSIYDSDNIKIDYAGSTTGGLIDSSIDDDLLLLSGLFVTNYYRQIALVIFVVIFIPILTNLSS